MRYKLPNEVQANLAPLIQALAELGYVPIGSRYDPDAFGNFYVDFHTPKDHPLRIIRDRNQYMVAGEKVELDAVGLFRAFDNRDEFARELLRWIGNR